jgi:sigma-B regulation protein RsbQ
MPETRTLARNNVRVLGNPDGAPIIFAHGFGGTQQSWRYVVPAFEDRFRVVLFDHMGAGQSDLSQYDRAKYDSLYGFADDINDIIEELDLHDVIFVGHSVAGMMGVLASNRAPDRFAHLIMLGPSPRYIDAEGYPGGFTQSAVDDLLLSLDSNNVSFSAALAPTLMGNPDRPELAESLAEDIQSMDPTIAAQFAHVTFLSDNRRDLPDVTIPTFILQSYEDNVAGPAVGRYVHEHIAGSTMQQMNSRGHVPNLSAPDEVARHILEYLT